jgi:hypothetical protein
MASHPEIRPSPPRSIADVAGDPLWLPHRYDPGHDAVHFRYVSRGQHGAATFLTDDHLGSGSDPIVVRRADAIAAAPPPAPLHLIVHSAYCCSTLLARAFDRPGLSMGLKEPVILNDIIGWRRRGGQGADMAEVLDHALRLLARPFAPGESVVVKPSNITNALVGPILTLRPDARAVLLRAPLRTYLASVAKKGMEGRLWSRTLLLGLLDDKLLDLGLGPRDLLALTDIQAAAVGWLAQQMLFQRLVEQFGADRLRTLDSEQITAEPQSVMRALGTLFGLPASETDIAQIVAGPAFTRHSKDGSRFGASERMAEDQAARHAFADEVDKVMVWADAVARQAGIAPVPPAPLIAS